MHQAGLVFMKSTVMITLPAVLCEAVLAQSVLGELKPPQYWRALFGRGRMTSDVRSKLDSRGRISGPDAPRVAWIFDNASTDHRSAIGLR